MDSASISYISVIVVQWALIMPIRLQTTGNQDRLRPKQFHYRITLFDSANHLLLTRLTVAHDSLMCSGSAANNGWQPRSMQLVLPESVS